MIEARGTAVRRPGVAAERGFTLIEVLVALVVVALGMSALLETLSASAGNIAALRDKTAAEWIAMNQIANVRLALSAPSIGTTTGDVRNCANGNWHWQQQVSAVDAVPGLLSITVSVQRTGAASASGSSSNSSSSSSSSSNSGSTGSASLGAGSALGAAINPVGCVSMAAPGSSLGAAGTLGAGSGPGAGDSLGAADSIGPTGPPGQASANAAASGAGSAAIPGTAGSGASGGSAASSSTTGLVNSLLRAGGGKAQSWLITLTGFRGNSLGAASGESPDWTGSTFAGEGGTNGIPNGGAVQGNLPSPAAPSQFGSTGVQ